jgi:hypothetical protein
VTGRPGDRWRASLPELSVAAILMTALALAGYAWAGINAAMLVLGCGAILALALMRTLPDADQEEAQAEEWQELTQTSIVGFWRRRGAVMDATSSMAAFELDLRPTLQHLLAARLSERHGISLYADPEAARRVLLAGGLDKNLWYWLDPERPASTDNRRGIPPRTLAAIIHRLEQL